MKTPHGKNKFEAVKTVCSKCEAVSFGSKAGQKHRKCPHKTPKDRGTWKKA